MPQRKLLPSLEVQERETHMGGLSIPGVSELLMSSVCALVNPRRACAKRVTVLVCCVCVCVCVFVCVLRVSSCSCYTVC